MKVSLSFEKTNTKDTSIMVDALRASTTITVALNNFKEIIPAFSIDEAIELGGKYNGIVAGERLGIRVEGFDVGNSPQKVENFKIPTDKSKTLILTTSNGTRILKDMKSTVLIGSFVNGKSVAKKAIEVSNGEIDVVMAGYKGNFALEDFLASGEILYWIWKLKENSEFTDFAKSGIIASRDYEKVQKCVYNSNSGIKLEKLGNKDDVDFCLQKNISENVGIYTHGKIKLL